MRRSRVLAAALLLALAADAACGWLAGGHREVARGALRTLPAGLPESSSPPRRRSPTWRSIPTSSAIAPRRRSPGPRRSSTTRPRAGAGLDLAAGRAEHLKGIRARGLEIAQVGLLPYAIVEASERLTLAFALLRRNGEDPAARAQALSGAACWPTTRPTPASRSTPRSTTTGGRCRSADRPWREPTCASTRCSSGCHSTARGRWPASRRARCRRRGRGACGDPGQSRARRTASTGWRRCWSLGGRGAARAGRLHLRPLRRRGAFVASLWLTAWERSKAIELPPGRAKKPVSEHRFPGAWGGVRADFHRV